MPFLKILLHVLGWHWLIQLYRFQEYDSITHHLRIALHVHHSKSNLLRPPLPFLTLPLVTTTLQSVFMSFCLSCLFVCCFWFYIPHMREIIWFLTFSIWLTFKIEFQTLLRAPWQPPPPGRPCGFSCLWYFLSGNSPQQLALGYTIGISAT